jgi:hypothetical protein
MALTADRTGPLHEPILELQEFQIAASTTIFLGALCSFNASGFLVPASDAAAQASKRIVLALENVNNSAGANGAKKVRCMTRGTAILPKGALVQADLGKTIHATDDNTLALTSTNSRALGSLVRVDGSLAAVQIG